MRSGIHIVLVAALGVRCLFAQSADNVTSAAEQPAAPHAAEPAGDGAAQLSAAIAAGDAERVRALLDARPDVLSPGSRFHPLHEAVAAGEDGIAKLLLDRKADVNAQGNAGRASPLHIAVFAGQSALVQLLLERGADVDARNSIGNTALHVAAALGDRESARLLLDWRAAPDAKSAAAERPLHDAALAGCRETVELLLAHGADVNATSESGQTPLLAAATFGHDAVVKMLLAYGADANAKGQDGQTALHLAMHRCMDEAKFRAQFAAWFKAQGVSEATPLPFREPMAAMVARLEHGRAYESVAELLVSHGANLNAARKDGGAPLHVAATCGGISAAGLLLARGADVNVQDNDGDTPLTMALLSEKLDVAEFLLASGARATVGDKNGATPLHWAALRDAPELAELLLDRGADKDARTAEGVAPIHAAARKGCDKALRVLLKRGADIEARDKEGSTPLHIAAANGQEQAAETLLASGARVEVKDAKGFTPLHRAAMAKMVAASEQRVLEDGGARLIEMLLSHKAEVNARNGEGATPLMIAVFAANEPAARVLLEHGADVDAATRQGATPLHVAVRARHKGMLQALLERGAATDVRPEGRGPTPLEMAEASKSAELVEVFKQEERERASRTHVGKLGGAENIAFEGMATFSAETVRAALAADPEYLVASHPWAPYREYLATVGRRIVAGFQGEGFANPRIAVRHDARAGRVIVSVAEGRRYTRGDVVIQGVRTIPVEALVRRLTQPWPPPEMLERHREALASLREKTGSDRTSAFAALSPNDEVFALVDPDGEPVPTSGPAWEKGSPVSFAQSSLRWLTTRVGAALRELGYFHAKLEVTIEPDEATGTARLAIAVADEGPRPTVDAVEIAGNTISSTEDMLKYLGIPRGTPLSRAAIARAELLLWRSARFLDFRVGPVPGATDPLQCTLRVEVKEHSKVRPLSQSFSAEEEALLKLRDRLCAFQSGAEDLVISGAAAGTPAPGQRRVRVVLSPRGLLGAIESLDERGEARFLFAAFASGDSLTLASPVRRKRLAFQTNRQLRIEASLSCTPEEKFSLRFKVFFTESDSSAPAADRGSIIAWRMVLAPVAFIQQAGAAGVTSTRSDDVVTMAGDGWDMALDARSGRLVEFTSRAEGEFEARVRHEAGAFDRAMQELSSVAPALENRYAGDRPASSFVEFLVEEALEGPLLERRLFKDIPVETRARAAQVVCRLLSRGLLSRLDLLAKPEARERETFWIPWGSPEDEAVALGALLMNMSTWVHRVSSTLFPKGSWPWTLGRELVCLLAGKADYAEREFQRILESPRTGPIGCLVIAESLASLQPQLARTFAAKGLERLSTADFRNDCRVFLDTEAALGKDLAGAAAEFRKLGPDDAAALAALLPAREGALFRSAAELLVRESDTPIDEILAPLLDALWEGAIKEPVQRELGRLSSAPPFGPAL